MFLQFQLVDASKAVLSQETLYRLHCVQFSLREGEEGGGGGGGGGGRVTTGACVHASSGSQNILETRLNYAIRIE